MGKPNIVLWDIETSHNILAKFDLREEYTNHANILQERYMICACWKTLGGKMKSVSVLDDKKRFKTNPCDDEHVIRTLYKGIEDADALVAHNGDRFDVKWFAGRALFYGLPPLPPIRTIDTLKVARSRFYLNSNRLDYLGKYLGFGGKSDTTPGLWLEALKGNAKAIRAMVDYNKRDVELLEQVFLKLEAYIPNHVNRHLHGDDGCPQCGSLRVQARGYVCADTRIYQRFACQNCGRWFRNIKAEPQRKAKMRLL